MPLQFGDKDILQDGVRCFAQVQVVDVCRPFLAHHCWNPILEGHQYCQAWVALSAVMVAVTNHLIIFHVP